MNTQTSAWFLVIQPSPWVPPASAPQCNPLNDVPALDDPEADQISAWLSEGGACGPED